jgi:hypothetical protein
MLSTATSFVSGLILTALAFEVCSRWDCTTAVRFAGFASDFVETLDAVALSLATGTPFAELA